jgi:CelD/BcsL family acetyltransferase involved in cellulose biosynthesis
MLRVDPGALGACFGREPVLVEHTLVDHPLLSQGELARLADELPDSLIEISRGEAPELAPDGSALRIARDAATTVRELATNGCRISLRFIERSPRYRDLVDKVLDDAEPIVRAIDGSTTQRRGFVFMGSGRSTTPAHGDPEHNFLLQCRGTKTVFLGRFPDPSVMQKEMERQHAGGHRNIARLPDDVFSFELTPGMGLYIPPELAHWVRSGDGMAWSLSLTFYTANAERAELVHGFNRQLRRLGVGPLPPGWSPTRDRAKALAMRGWSAMQHRRRSDDDGADQPRALTTIEQQSLGRDASEWDALIDASPDPSPFLRSWWLEGTAANRATYVLVRDGDELVGGAAFVSDHARGVLRHRLLGARGLSPHGLDLVAQTERADDVTQAIRDWLTRPGTRIVDLEGLAPDSRLRRCAPGPVHLEMSEGAPRIGAHDGFEAFLATRNRKLRQEIRRVVRRLEEAGVSARVVDSSNRSEVDRALATLERLHILRWGSASLFRSSFDRFARAARLGAARDEVRFHEAVAENVVVGSVVTFELGDACFVYQTGRNPDPRWRNSGTYLRTKVVQRSCELGHRKIDLCYGESPYKLEWADSAEPVLRVRWANGLVASAALAALVYVGEPAARRVRGEPQSMPTE